MKDNYNYLTAIRLEEDPTVKDYDHFNDDNAIKGLARTNIFIGANNSGKSRYLRELFIQDYSKYTSRDYSLSTINDIIREEWNKAIPLYRYSERPHVEYRLIDDVAKNVFDSFLNNPPNPLAHKLSDYRTLALNAIPKLEPKNERCIASTGHDRRALDLSDTKLFRSIFDDIRKRIEDLPLTNVIAQREYLPILRGMRPPIEENGSICFFKRSKNDYFSDGRVKDVHFVNARRIFTGLEIYEKLKTMLLGEPDGRKSVAEFQEFLSRSFFDNLAVTLIPKIDDDVVNIKIGDTPQYPIHQVGDGLQNLIILTFPIFMAGGERKLFFIEEPDLAMHPGMQRKFLEVLQMFKQHQYFITTHSNHLLDMTMDFDDISVYLFRKKTGKEGKSFEIVQASTADDNVLCELGVRSSSVFRTNATIWVEGITDRMYLRMYMKKYLEENQDKVPVKYQEDTHYSFVEYQGSNLVHWTFDKNDEDKEKIRASYIVKDSFLIADGDVSNKGSREADYREMLHDNFYILNCKEIENLIPEVLLRKAVEDYLGDSAGEMDVSKIQYDKYFSLKTGVGGYLDKRLGLQGKFGEESGTLKNKMSFCKRIVELSGREEWTLPPELEELCEKIFKFIERQNA